MREPTSLWQKIAPHGKTIAIVLWVLAAFLALARCKDIAGLIIPDDPPPPQVGERPSECIQALLPKKQYGVPDRFRDGDWCFYVGIDDALTVATASGHSFRVVSVTMPVKITLHRPGGRGTATFERRPDNPCYTPAENWTEATIEPIEGAGTVRIKVAIPRELNQC